MALDKKQQAKYDAMSLTELIEVEKEVHDARDMFAQTYIKKRKALLEAEPTKTRRQTYLAIVLVAGLSVILIAVAFIVPVISAWLRS